MYVTELNENEVFCPVCNNKVDFDHYDECLSCGLIHCSECIDDNWTCPDCDISYNKQKQLLDQYYERLDKLVITV